jgi:hypothetical protein
MLCSLQAIEAGAAPDTVDMLAFEACAWGLLELFYVLAPATEGYFAEVRTGPTSRGSRVEDSSGRSGPMCCLSGDLQASVCSLLPILPCSQSELDLHDNPSSQTGVLHSTKGSVLTASIPTCHRT